MHAAHTSLSSWVSAVKERSVCSVALDNLIALAFQLDNLNVRAKCQPGIWVTFGFHP